ncbi:Uncharacterized protein SCF082_LOCUS15807 [Durusdinium trenchii]|uniref:DNA (cytosine-5-)-methyltransferase n=1 Tax=Durusdinium trenchii TaxID=1381693 RepID=A0ABP0K7F1_9DINO
MHNPHFEELRTKLADTFSQVNRITVGSMFTGWGVLEMVLHSLERLWNQAHSEDAHFEVGGVELKFMAECEKKKQAYLESRFPGACIFSDVADMKSLRARTSNGGSHEVPVDLLVGGFPCVNVSHLTSTPGSVTDESCSSGRGYLGLENYVTWRKPSLILMENVASLFEKRKVEDGQTAFKELGDTYGKDQNFNRQTIPKSNFELARLQGIGTTDWVHYNMSEVGEATMRFSVPVLLGALISVLANWRFNSGRLVGNLDGAQENVFLTTSELGLCGRPLQGEEDIVLPLSKDMLLPESLDAESDLKQAERQRPSIEACQAQKLKDKPCIILNLTGYIEDAFNMRLENEELKGGFKTEMLFYHSVQWLTKDSFGHVRLLRQITDAWTQRKFGHAGHKFSMELPELSQEEVDSIPGGRASLGSFDEMRFEILERVGNRMVIKSDEHKYWSGQTGALLAEYEDLRQGHLELVGQSSAVAVVAAEGQATTEEPTSTPARPTFVEVESLSKLEETHGGIELKVNSEAGGVELILCKDGTIWLLCGQNRTIPKHSVLAGFGTGQWLPEAECTDGGVPFAVPHGDRTLVQIDEASFSTEAQGNQTLTLYKLLLRAETEKQLTEHRVSFLKVERKATVEAGQDGFEVTIKNGMTFKCLRDPRTQQGEERLTSKNFFSKCLASLPRETAMVVFRFRYERVGQNFKIQRPYVIASVPISLRKDVPLKLS